MNKVFVILFFMSIVNYRVVTAQELLINNSCPVADSLIGPLPSKFMKLTGHFDIMTDSSLFILGGKHGLFNSLMTTNAGNLEYQYEAIIFNDTTTYRIRVLHGASIDNLTHNANNGLRGNFLKTILFLLNDSTKIMLTSNYNSVLVDDNPIVRMSLEEITYPISNEQLLLMLNANNVRIRFGSGEVLSKDLKNDRDEFNKLREFYRYIICKSSK